ncbi:MAG: DegT/DnrJ/EryC1/StrS family aminotransferase, partial [Eubacteriales bacterium]|nr:DegT/DnrJ/EryC1/StrS family aminotransferase [Eubacteriales bacterium]
ANCKHNAHMFYIKVKDLEVRTRLIDHLKNKGIMSVFHYIPLHSSPAGQKYGRFHGQDIFTTGESERLLRLPLYYGLEDSMTNEIVEIILSFFRKGE